jgi:type VI secretion system secreted protein Hcp
MTVLKRLVAASAGTLIVFHTLLASAAIDAMAWVSGAKVGEIDGHAQRDSKATTVLEFTHGPTKPGDLKSGLASGKRIHEPITMLLRVDGASAEPWKSALKQQDKLQVKVAFYRTAAASITATPAAAQHPYYTLTLGDAVLEKLEVVTPDKVQDPGSRPGATYLRVSFTFQKIDWTYADPGRQSSDDWTI